MRVGKKLRFGRKVAQWRGEGSEDGSTDRASQLICANEERVGRVIIFFRVVIVIAVIIIIAFVCRFRVCVFRLG